MVLDACSDALQMRPRLQIVVQHVFSEFTLSECEASDLIKIFVALGRIRHKGLTEWELLLEELKSYQRLCHFRPEDFVSVLKTYIDMELKNDKFVDRLLFEAGQPQQLTQFSLNELVALIEMTSQFKLRNMTQILAQEILIRKASIADPTDLLTAWAAVGLEEQIFLNYFKKLSRKQRRDAAARLVPLLDGLQYKDAVHQLNGS